MAFPNALLSEQPNSPRLRKDEAYKYVDRIYQVTGRFTEQELIQGEYLPEEGYVDPETDTFYVGHEYDSAVGFPLVTLHFKRRIIEDALYDAHEASYEKPIERHPDFLMKWKYNLLGKVAKGSTALPAFSATATDASDLVANTGYLWSTSLSSGEFKYVWQAAEKEGVSTYLQGSTVITKRKVYTEYQNQWIGEVGKLCLPADAAGLTGTADNWLIRDVRRTEESDGSFVVTVEWIYSEDGWDTDIYSASSIEDDGY